MYTIRDRKLLRKTTAGFQSNTFINIQLEDPYVTPLYDTIL